MKYEVKITKNVKKHRFKIPVKIEVDDEYFNYYNLYNTIRISISILD